MPIYEYKCAKCGEAFEWLHLASREVPACPKCGAAGAERVLSTFAVRAGNGKAPQACRRAGEDCNPGTGHSCCAGCTHS